MLDLDSTEEKCSRCGGVKTIPTPDGKSHQICPVCKGTGKADINRKPRWG